MTDPAQRKSTLPKLDQTDDPRGGAVAWALLVVGAVLIGGIVRTVKWAAPRAW
jgi:hypothetical protein